MNNGQNLVLNDTETREIYWVANGKPFNRDVQMEGVRCIGGCLDDVTDVEVEDDFRYWSKLEDWDETITQLPQEGDNVQIQPGWNMIYDIEDSPILDMLTINGRLTFDN